MASNVRMTLDLECWKVFIIRDAVIGMKVIITGLVIYIGKRILE